MRTARKQWGGACGQCKQCQLFASETHSDFICVQPEEKSRYIKVDAIRSVTEFLAKSSLQGGAKVAIIEPAEALNVNAANALLKTLEEPASKTYILLVSHSPGRLLPTIKSRCQHLELASPTEHECLEWLSDHVDGDLDQNALKTVLNAVGGAPLRAASLLKTDVAESLKEMIPSLISVMRGDVSITGVAESWDDAFLNLRMTVLLSGVEQIILYAATNDALHIKDERAVKMFEYLSNKASPDQLFSLRDRHLDQIKLLAGSSNPNPRMLLEDLLGAWKQLMKRAA